jgi:hypothetical protein
MHGSSTSYTEYCFVPWSLTICSVLAHSMVLPVANWIWPVGIRLLAWCALDQATQTRTQQDWQAARR